MHDLYGKVGVVTGAASGIGKVLVDSFLRVGMKVVMADIDEEKLKEEVVHYLNSGAEVLGVVCDVSQPEHVERLSQKSLETFGAVHLLCNNAGVGYNGFRSWEAPLRVWDWVLKVNLMSVIHGIHYFMPIMLKQDTQAHIINTASSAGVITNAYGIPYAVSKHGVMALTESLFLELQSYTTKIKVSVLCPGIVKTDILNSSERSRPADVPIPQRISQEESVFIEAQKRYIEQSQDPQEIGDLVLEAIKEERLYIMTTRDFDKDIEQRMKNLLERKNPIAQKPSRKFIDILHDLSRENG